MRLIDNREVLINDNRVKIYNAITDNPGIHMREISRKLQISFSTVRHHIRRLKKQEMIRIEMKGNESRIHRN